MNYSDLKTNLADWLVKDNLTTQIDTFIDLAEADMNAKLKHWRMNERTTLSVSSQYTSLPADFMAFISATLSDTTPRRMEGLSRSQIQEMRELNDDTAGKPQYFCITGGQMEVYPTPDSTYSVDLEYRTIPDALSDSNTTNWISTYHPSIYLYGALSHAAPYLKDDERIPVWVSAYREAIENANMESRDAEGSSSLRLRINSY